LEGEGARVSARENVGVLVVEALGGGEGGEPGEGGMDAKLLGQLALGDRGIDGGEVVVGACGVVVSLDVASAGDVPEAGEGELLGVALLSEQALAAVGVQHDDVDAAVWQALGVDGLAVFPAQEAVVGVHDGD
jgi:hypothetical protein